MSSLQLFFPRVSITLLVPLVFAVGLVAASGVMAEDFWVTDPDSGCKVWSDEAVPDLAASWSGECAEGRRIGRINHVCGPSGKYVSPNRVERSTL